MFGIIIAIVIAVFTIFVSSNTMEVGFISALDFLWVWYWIWTVLQGLIIAFIMLIITGVLTFSGANILSSKAGAFLGIAAGGALSILFVTKLAIRSILLLGGVYLLMTSGNAEMTFSEFDNTKLIFGAILLLIGLIMSKNSSSSSSSN